MSTFGTGTFGSGTFGNPGGAAPPAVAGPQPVLPLVTEVVEPKPVGEVGLRLYREMEPVAYADAQTAHSLLYYLGAIGQMLEEGNIMAGDVIIGGQRVPGWSVMVDLDRAPSKALGWLAQFVGVSLDRGLSDELQRERIRETDGWKRGSLGAFMGAARLFLTGARTVILRERYTSAYRILVITRTYETPDSEKVFESLLSQKPAGLVLEYRVVSGRTYLEVRDENANYSAARTAYSSYEMMRSTRPEDVPPSTPLAPEITLVPNSTLTPGG